MRIKSFRDLQVSREVEQRAQRVEAEGRPDLAILLRSEARLMNDPLARGAFGYTSLYSRGAVLQTTGIGFTVGGLVGMTAGLGGGAAVAALAAAGGAAAGAALGIPLALALCAILRQRVRERLAGVESLTPEQRAHALNQELKQPALPDRAAGAVLGGLTGLAEGFLGGSSLAWEFSNDQPGGRAKAAGTWAFLSPTVSGFGIPAGGVLGWNRGWHEGTRSLGFAGGAAAAGAMGALLCPWLAVPAALVGGVLAGAWQDPLPSRDRASLYQLLGSDIPSRLVHPELVDVGIRLVTGLDMTPADAALTESLLGQLDLDRRLELMADLDARLASKSLSGKEVGPYLRSLLPGMLGVGFTPPAAPGVHDQVDRVRFGPVSLKKRPPVNPLRRVMVNR